MDEKRKNDGAPGTINQPPPSWEGPDDQKPPGYLPPEDDPYSEHDAAGEHLKKPEGPKEVDNRT